MPTWSPDGTQIAFVSERDSEIPNIFIMRADVSDVRQITHDTASKSELAWSPRGDRIAFVRVPAGGGDRDIYSVKTDGSGLIDLSNDPTNSTSTPPGHRTARGLSTPVGCGRASRWAWTCGS